jgi:O-antigen ligase
MATAAVRNNDTTWGVWTPADDRHGWGLALLLAAVVSLFVRPADLVPALGDWPIYQFLIVCCLVVSARAMFRQLGRPQLAERTVTTCLLVLLASVAVSHLAHGLFWMARMSAYDVAKLLALYLLMIGLINTPQRLTIFMQWLTITITVVAVLALLDHFDIISIAAITPVKSHGGIQEGGSDLVERIRGTGIFQDPNDFGLILVTGLTFSVAFLSRPGAGWPRYAWLGPALALLTALALTHSRGALVSLICILPAVAAYRRGWRTTAVAVLSLPVLAAVFSSRMMDITALDEGTGQSRIQAWSDSLTVFRQYPLLGLGHGALVEKYGMVTHNSFLHCFAELGLLGGTAFLGCFLAAGLELWSARPRPEASDALDSRPQQLRDLIHVRAFVFAALAGYAAGILTLSRQFVAPTYLILGLATATAALDSASASKWQHGTRFVLVALTASALLLVGLYATVRLLVRW